MHPYTAIFMGPQGSGKGTQIGKLDAAFRRMYPTEHVVVIQTGRLFRALAQRQKTYTGRHLAETLDSGILQPHFLTVALWGEVMINQLDLSSHLLIDGFPRTLGQAHLFEDALRFYKRVTLTVINLTAPEETVQARMHSRARPDDTDAAIAERLRLYHEETIPVLDLYRARFGTTVLDIDGTGTIEAIHETILRGIGLYSKQ